MSRKALHHKGKMTEFVTVHPLLSIGTWFKIAGTLGFILFYWILSPKHKITLI